jgi:hypothetical protein
MAVPRTNLRRVIAFMVVNTLSWVVHGSVLPPRLGGEGFGNSNTRLALVVFASIVTAYFVTLFTESFTGAPLARGGMEGTPNTILAIITMFPLSLIASLVFGNIWLNWLTRWFRARGSK